MKILVTGGAGFIGSHVADAYLENGHEVAVVDNLNSGRIEHVNKNARFFETDIRNIHNLEDVIGSFKPDVINHHAAQISVTYSMKNPQLDLEINIKGTLNLLELAQKYRIKKFIFSSTGGALYGDPVYSPCDEKHPILPLSPYGINKATAEHYIRIYAQNNGFEFVILRYANVYGPRQDPFGEAGVIAIFTARMLKKEKCMIFGDGTQARDFVYVKDVVRANLFALSYKRKDDILPIFNIGTARTTTINDLYSLLSRVTGYNETPLYQPAREGEVYKISLSFEKAKTYLGWEPTYTLQEGLSETANWFKKEV